METNRSIVVFGAGAVGGYLGGKLAGNSRQPPNVTLLGRARMAEAVQAHGLVIEELDHQEVTHPAVAISRDSVPECDLVLLAVRTYDVPAAIPDVRALMGDRGMLIAWQNGVGTEEVLARTLGPDRVLAGTLTVSAGMQQPGIVTRFSRKGGIALSTLSGDSVPNWVLSLFAATGLPTISVSDYRQLRWSKLLLNMLGAASSAIVDIDMAGIMADRRLFRIEQLAFREAVRVMNAQGIKAVELPGYAVPQARLAMRTPRILAQATLGKRVARARGGRSPGMRADLARGKTEIDSFNGAVAAAGQGCGVRTPVNAALTALTLDLAAHAERRDRFRGQPEKLVAHLRRAGVKL